MTGPQYLGPQEPSVRIPPRPHSTLGRAGEVYTGGFSFPVTGEVLHPPVADYPHRFPAVDEGNSFKQEKTDTLNKETMQCVKVGSVLKKASTLKGPLQG